MKLTTPEQNKMVFDIVEAMNCGAISNTAINNRKDLIVFHDFTIDQVIYMTDKQVSEYLNQFFSSIDVEVEAVNFEII